MNRGKAGEYRNRTVGGERIASFIPFPLPPQPALVWDGPLQQALEAATLALGRLDGVATT